MRRMACSAMPFGEGRGRQVDIGFECVSQGVHAGRRADKGGQGDRQVGIEDAELGRDLPANDWVFVAAGRIVQHGEGRDFAGSAVGRGDAGEIGQVVCDFVAAQILGDAASVGREDADHLGHVHGRATAEADDGGAAFSSVSLGSIFDGFLGRLTRTVFEIDGMGDITEGGGDGFHGADFP